jgi:hypothetical protein
MSVHVEINEIEALAIKQQAFEQSQDYALTFERDVWDFKKDMAAKIMRHTLRLNGWLVVALIAIFATEMSFIYQGKLTESARILNNGVLLALISAITVQVGAIAYAVSNWLFK